MTIFSDWLTSQLRKQNISPAQLSRLINKDQSVISRILNSERSPANETLEAIAHALRLPPEEVFRAAGILPPSKVKGEKTSLMDYLFEQLDPESQEDLLALARAKVERQEEKARAAKIKKPATQAR